MLNKVNKGKRGALLLAFRRVSLSLSFQIVRTLSLSLLLGKAKPKRCHGHLLPLFNAHLAHLVPPSPSQQIFQVNEKKFHHVIPDWSTSKARGGKYD